MESLELARSQILDLGGVIAMRARDMTLSTLFSWILYDESRALRNSHWRASCALAPHRGAIRVVAPAESRCAWPEVSPSACAARLHRGLLLFGSADRAGVRWSRARRGAAAGLRHGPRGGPQRFGISRAPDREPRSDPRLPRETTPRGAKELSLRSPSPERRGGQGVRTGTERGSGGEDPEGARCQGA